METWLKTNTRAIAFGMVLPGLVLCLMLIILAVAPTGEIWLRVGSGIIAGLSALVLLLLFAQVRRPRLAYHEGHLLVFLRASGPLYVPIDHVEAFFLGRGPSLLPGENNRSVQTMNLIVRLAEKGTDYHQRDVKPALGAWCDGYITVRGTWCEPLNTDVASRLNRALHTVKQQRREEVAT